MKPDDVIAAAVSAYLTADDEGKEELEEAVRSLKARQASGGMSFQQVADVLKGVTDLMTTVQQTAQNLVRASLVNEIKGVMQTVEDIKKILA